VQRAEVDEKFVDRFEELGEHTMARALLTSAIQLRRIAAQAVEEQATVKAPETQQVLACIPELKEIFHHPEHFFETQHNHVEEDWRRLAEIVIKWMPKDVPNDFPFLVDLLKQWLNVFEACVHMAPDKVRMGSDVLFLKVWETYTWLYLLLINKCTCSVSE